MSARFCAKCGSPFRARGEVVCGLCGAPRVRTGTPPPDDDVVLPPELAAQLEAARSSQKAPRRSPMIMGCLGVILVGVILLVGMGFCAGNTDVGQNEDVVLTPAPLFTPG